MSLSGRSRRAFNRDGARDAAIGFDAFDAAYRITVDGDPVIEVLDDYPSVAFETISAALDVLDAASYVCPECHCPCEATSCDSGIGSYEFWGRTGFDSRPYPGSDCCEAELDGADFEDSRY